ncbi:unnamed protein product [Acanthoscelides obtectus]|uniref:Nuclease HARBI1 n=1 Tax=Acanthoscelides obtectus TaxID=200917 RepID=A0A9P0JJM5_ACAOB|nr:unnamed protein product [Acanthoscelides obtectus]CAK1649936.1 Protein ANTAGONIST OF LIKE HETEROCHROMATIN PROTEIN 1 [Acanthoscelides obtectus]
MNENRAFAIVSALQETLDTSSDDEELISLIFSSSSSKETDGVEVYAVERRGPMQKRPRIEEFVERTVPGFSSEEFKSHFRMLPETFEFVLGHVGPLLSTAGPSSRPQTPAKTQLLLVLWLMATPDSYRSACTKFNVGKATCVRSMRRVCRALHTLAPRFIRWPEGQRAQEVIGEFVRASAFPGVIGAIDGTHIEINKPKDDEHNAYCNRKGYPSCILQ